MTLLLLSILEMLHALSAIERKYLKYNTGVDVKLHWPEIVKSFELRSVLVVVDIILDEYIVGHVERICPEAPVPVVSVTKRDYHLGGAANVAHNIVTLGARSTLCGVIGNDSGGETLLSLLSQKKIAAEGVHIDPSRPTSQKTRVIAQN